MALLHPQIGRNGTVVAFIVDSHLRFCSFVPAALDFEGIVRFDAHAQQPE